mgnify:FL=1
MWERSNGFNLTDHVPNVRLSIRKRSSICGVIVFWNAFKWKGQFYLTFQSFAKATNYKCQIFHSTYKVIENYKICRVPKTRYSFFLQFYLQNALSSQISKLCGYFFSYLQIYIVLTEWMQNISWISSLVNWFLVFVIYQHLSLLVYLFTYYVSFDLTSYRFERNELL